MTFFERSSSSPITLNRWPERSDCATYCRKFSVLLFLITFHDEILQRGWREGYCLSPRSQVWFPSKFLYAWTLYWNLTSISDVSASLYHVCSTHQICQLAWSRSCYGLKDVSADTTSIRRPIPTQKLGTGLPGRSRGASTWPRTASF